MRTIRPEPLTQQAFEPFGDVIEIAEGRHHYPINGGTTERYHDLSAAIASGEESRVILSMARAKRFELPHTIAMLERHPEGSQAFVPVQPVEFLVIVAPDENGRPGAPRAFLAAPGQGVNYFLGTWHGVLTALGEPADFLIVDRDGLGSNLEEFHLDEPVRIEQ